MNATESIRQAMLEFESQWFRYGGGPSEEIFARFGMNERAFFSEMHDLIGGGEVVGDVAPRDAEVMRAVVRRRLWLAS